MINRPSIKTQNAVRSPLQSCQPAGPPHLGRPEDDGVFLPGRQRRRGEEDEEHAVPVRRVAGGEQSVGPHLEADQAPGKPQLRPEVFSSQGHHHHWPEAQRMEVHLTNHGFSRLVHSESKMTR